MAHGTPDWGVTNALWTVYRVLDMGELAARLGSIVTFDRRGDALFLEAFENGLAHWGVNTNGSYARVSILRDAARKGAYSVELQGGLDGQRRAQIYHSEALPIFSPLGVELSFAIPGNVETTTLLARIFTGTVLRDFAIRFDDDGDTLSYLDSGGAYVPFATGVNPYRGRNVFHTAKLIFDPEARTYRQYILDDAVYDLLGISAYEAANPGSSRLYVAIEVISHAGLTETINVDDLILTQNEPV